MKTIKTFLYFIIEVIVLTSFLGCSEDLLNEKPPHLISTESLYTSLNGFEAGLNGLYATLRLEKRAFYGDDEIRAGIYLAGTDNLVVNSPSTIHINLITREWKDTNHPLQEFYADAFLWLYSIINAANTIINQAENRTDVDWTGGGASVIENKNRIIGEAKALRAWAYRHLTYAWGDVPLTIEESLASNIKTDWERAPVEEVRRQIISDLIFAEKAVPVEPIMRGRISKGAVQHYLSEMYLVIKKPDSALYWADKVIENSQYQLITERFGVRKDQPGVPFMDMFYEGNENRNQGNTEALWVWQFAQDIQGGGRNITRRFHISRYRSWVIDGVTPFQVTTERGGSGNSRQSLTKFAIDLYENHDHRASNYALRKYYILKDESANAPYPADNLPAGYSFGDTIHIDWSEDISTSNCRVNDWPHSRKVEMGNNPNNPSLASQFCDVVYLRLAETYLLKAEAEYLLGNLEGAANTINVVRERSNASNVSPDKIDIDFILDERSRELVMEEHRRWTLLRTGKWYERTRLHNHNGGQNITLRDTLYPIPQVVIDANLTKGMTQNPGY